MRAKIIAVDFDGTLVENKWPDIGDTNEEVLNYCKHERENGARIILWTNRVGQALENAVAWCEANGLHLDAVNDNVPEVVEHFGFNTRKIYADEYIDDKAKLPRGCSSAEKCCKIDILTVLQNADAVNCTISDYEYLHEMSSGRDMYKIPNGHFVTVDYNKLARALYDVGYRKG